MKNYQSLSKEGRNQGYKSSKALTKNQYSSNSNVRSAKNLRTKFGKHEGYNFHSRSNLRSTKSKLKVNKMAETFHISSNSNVNIRNAHKNRPKSNSRTKDLITKFSRINKNRDYKTQKGYVSPHTRNIRRNKKYTSLYISKMSGNSANGSKLGMTSGGASRLESKSSSTLLSINGS